MATINQLIPADSREEFWSAVGALGHPAAVALAGKLRSLLA